jgi:hypothetical protein
VLWKHNNFLLRDIQYVNELNRSNQSSLENCDKEFLDDYFEQSVSTLTSISISAQDVEDAITTLNTNKASGPYESHLVWNLVRNYSFSTVTFLKLWKMPTFAKFLRKEIRRYPAIIVLYHSCVVFLNILF